MKNDKTSLTLDRALLKLAAYIWHKGNSEFIGQGCFNPWYFRTGATKYDPTSVDDVIVRATTATHFDRKWETPGETVRINLYCAEEFGAAEVTESHLISTHLIRLENK